MQRHSTSTHSLTHSFPFTVPDSYIGALSSSMFAGMMFGAIGWGTCELIELFPTYWNLCFLTEGSDLMGRSTAFNATLFFTSIFGLMASFATSFVSLCVLLFFLGSAVGVSHFPQTPQPITHPNLKGSMPTDGTLLLEHMPKGKQYLVTALSVFFSFGAVLSAIVAILVVPQHSCTASEATCEVETENNGWQYMLMTLGIIVCILSMLLR
jgi:MFS family permease